MRGVAPVTAVVLSLVLVALGGKGGARADSSRPNPSAAVTHFDRTLGDQKAPVTLIEYGSPSCPVCARFNADVFPQIKQKYIDTGKVRYVFRVFPLRAEDGDAEKLARCMPDNKYFLFMDVLFRNQANWDPEYRVPDAGGALVSLAAETGLTADEAVKCINDSSQDATINEVARGAQEKYGINGTPSFVIDGGAQSPGFRSFEQLSTLLDAELAKQPVRY